MPNYNYPSDWAVLSIKELTAEFLNGGTPSTHIKEFWGGNIPWITGADAEQKVTTISRKSITELGVKQSSTNVVPKNNILLVTRTGVGKVSISGVDVAISQDLTGLIPKSDLVDIEYLYYQLIQLSPALIGLTQGSIIQGVQREEVEALTIPVPALSEQRKIAEILSTLDDAIAQTEALIRKQERVKQGLMSDLLTRGVDENGEVRPSADERPELYKHSQFGNIPKVWDVTSCSSICYEIVVGIVIRPTQYYVTDGIPALRSKNIKKNGINGDDLVFISSKSNQLLTKSMLRTGNVVTVRTGEPGTSCVIPDSYDGANCIDLIISRPKPMMDSDFLALWINSSFGRNQVLENQGGLAQQHFNVGHMKQLQVVLPKIEEQQIITHILNSHQELIEQERALKNKLQSLKRGLMQDLLSGAVRVKE